MVHSELCCTINLERQHKLPAQFLHSQKLAIYLSLNQQFPQINSPVQDEDLQGWLRKANNDGKIVINNQSKRPFKASRGKGITIVRTDNLVRA